MFSVSVDALRVATPRREVAIYVCKGGLDVMAVTLFAYHLFHQPAPGIHLEAVEG
jgi:hypothetical protein